MARKETPKEVALAFVQRMKDDVTMEQVIYNFDLFVSVQQGLLDINRGDCMEHDEFMAQLEKEDAEEEARVVEESKKRVGTDQTVHRKGLAKKRQGVRGAAKASAGET